MALIERALSKLRLEAYSGRDDTSPVKTLEVMYNPASLDLSYAAQYEPQPSLGDGQSDYRYQQVRPGQLTLELILEAVLPGKKASVDHHVDGLRGLCFDLDEKTGEPRFLRVRWGKMTWHGDGYFAGRATTLLVNYTVFDHDASPLCATATLTLIADQSLKTQKSSGSAPDPSVLKSPGRDSLPMLAQAAPLASDYLSLAQRNELDNLTAMAPGVKLVVGPSTS